MQGRRIVAFGEGRVTGGGGSGFAAIRLRRDGSLDRSFGRRGRRLVSFGRRRWARPVSFDLAPGGKIVIGGNSGTDIFRWRPAVARLTRNGGLDRSFSGDGRVLTRIRPFGGGAFAGLSPDVSFLAPWGSGLLAAGDSGGALGLARFTY